MEKGRLLARGRTAEVFEWGETKVLKLFLKDDNVNQEMTNTTIINQIGLPAAEVFELVEIEDRKGIIYERIVGSTLMRLIEPTESSLSKHAKVMAALHAEIHRATHKHPPNLKQELTKKINRLNHITIENRTEIIRLLDNLPAAHTICHYDFHPDNIIMSPRGPIIVDWFNTLVGNPNADIMRTLLMLRSHALPDDPPDWLLDRNCRLFFHDVYLTEYLRLQEISKEEIDVWLVPTIAVRLGEVVEEEEKEMLHLLNQELQKK
ncbi:phosphotransferase family protein [Paenibacillus radicis (ex Xue et al. 2023)]|uniref:Phosphotransferase n=1 Tax=Paenibacillus radicis (ex Xue et al. 2023) TaxID=2972489 RepID=A0ABT1YPS7_9BACL|nr:aminoglycoside phosphotransferase family protein [Paenibacillus radicis (ex Xue et al. 2023)]MCR8635179.1 phosphotransferase [Paenibacillus radicis (ex Xue et al. 2023)]